MKAQYNKLFDKITSDLSDDELLYAALRKAEAMETKKKSIKKPVIAACAAAAVVALGITGAAAAGVLRFDELFGKQITAPSEELSINLMGQADVLNSACSSDDYEVLLKGVTGTANSIIANISAVRSDGKPISGDADLGRVAAQCEGSDGKLTASYRSGVVENGAASFTVELSMAPEDFSSEDGLAGKTIFMEITGIELDGAEPFDFSVEYVYTPSEASLGSLSCADLTHSCSILFNISGEGELPTGRDIPFEVQLDSIDLRAEKGVISGSYDLGGYDFDKYVMNTFMCKNDIALVMADGSTAAASLGGYRKTLDGGRVSFTMELEYKSIYDEAATAVDLAQVMALSINGTEYKMS